MNLAKPVTALPRTAGLPHRGGFIRDPFRQDSKFFCGKKERIFQPLIFAGELLVLRSVSIPPNFKGFFVATMILFGAFPELLSNNSIVTFPERSAQIHIWKTQQNHSDSHFQLLSVQILDVFLEDHLDSYSSVVKQKWELNDDKSHG